METTLQSGDSRALRARVAVSIAFLILGAGPGLWAVHIPLVQERLGISPAILGLALLTMAGGAVIAMPIMGWAVGRMGSRLPMAAGMILYVILTPLPILAGSVPLFFVALFFFGLLMGSLDVVGNVQAAEVETLRRRPTMSSFHAFYSIGGLAGAVVGAWVISRGWGDGTGAAMVCAVLLVAAIGATGGLLPGARAEAGTPHFALPDRAVVGLGIVAFLCFALEGAVTDWSALFLTTSKVATPETAAVGYAAYAFAMAALRLFGDPIVHRLGAEAGHGRRQRPLRRRLRGRTGGALAGDQRAGLRPGRARRRQHRPGAVLGRRAHARRRLRRRRLGRCHPRLLGLPVLPADPRRGRRRLRHLRRDRHRPADGSGDDVDREPSELASAAD